MIRRVNRYKGREKVYFICPTRNKSMGCTRHSILEEELKAVVFQVLQAYAPLFLDVCGQQENIRRTEVRFEEVAGVGKEIERLHREQDKYMELRAGLYEDLKTGLITEADFKSFRSIYEKQYEEITDALRKQEKLVKRLFCSGISSGVKLKKFREEMEITELNRDALLCFISRIEVYEEKKVYVEFRGKEEFGKMAALKEDPEAKVREGRA